MTKKAPVLFVGGSMAGTLLNLPSGFSVYKAPTKAADACNHSTTIPDFTKPYAPTHEVYRRVPGLHHQLGSTCDFMVPDGRRLDYVCGQLLAAYMNAAKLGVS